MAVTFSSKFKSNFLILRINPGLKTDPGLLAGVLGSEGGRSLEEKPSLDFAEDDVHVGGGDALAVGDVAVLAHLCKVLAVHLVAGGLAVAVDGKLLEGRLHLGQETFGRHPGSGEGTHRRRSQTNTWKHQISPKSISKMVGAHQGGVT